MSALGLVDGGFGADPGTLPLFTEASDGGAVTTSTGQRKVIPKRPISARCPSGGLY